jgi:hypothetical protein
MIGIEYCDSMFVVTVAKVVLVVTQAPDLPTFQMRRE